MRNNKRVVGTFLILVMAVVACASSDSTALQGVNQGNLARDFDLETVEGERASLSDYRGSVVLINFWAAWCPPCRAEIPDLEAAYRSHGDEGLVVLGINVQDSAQLVKPFVQDMGMTYPVLLDESGQLMKEYRAPGLPMSLVVDREGVIQERHIGYLSAEQLADYLAKVLPDS
jgi:peroxiredoxin